MSKALKRVALLSITLAFASVTAGAIAQQSTAPAPAPKAPAAKATTPAKAKSPCAGLTETACRAAAECSWVPATKRKDGKTVKAYCRKKTVPKTPVPKAKTPAPAAK
jgi:hypothetical protein